MWWEVVTELAYKMALDCGQAQEFFRMVDELSKHSGSQQKISSQSAMSTLLGQDWGNHRKRGRDPIRRISHFNGMLDEDNDKKKDHPESVLVKRSKPPQEEPVRDMMSILKRTPVDITDKQSASQRSLSISPVKTTEKFLPAKSLQQNPSRSLQTYSTAVASQQKSSNMQNISRKADASRSPALRIKSPEKNQNQASTVSDSSRDGYRQSRYEVEKKQPSKPVSDRTGKPGLAEKKQKAKKRRISTKSTTKEYVVNGLKSVKANDNGELVYLVEWRGDWDDTWEPYHFVAHLEDDIEQVYQNASPDIQAAMRTSGHIEPVD